MRPSRRDLLRGGFYAGAAAAAGPIFFPRRPAAATPSRTARMLTTADRTVLRGAAGPGGYRRLVSGPGEPWVVRTELGGTPHRAREHRRRPLAAFVQFTDTHVIDAQSPARVEFLDRYSDGPGSQIPFDSAYRPHEMLSAELVAGLVRAVKGGRAPVTGVPIQFTVCTGDIIDNAQYNELRWFVDVLDGETVVPDSGDRTRWEGVHDQHPDTYDVHYWHPDGTPPGKQDDLLRAHYGFPVVPGLLDAARGPLRVAGGLGMPYYAAFGNHDPLLQGNSPSNPVLEGIATGPVKVVSMPAGLSPQDVYHGLTQQDPAILAALLAAPARTVTADPERRILSRAAWMAEFFETSGTPVGHGFAQDNLTTGRGYYALDHGPQLRLVVLDTVNPGGYAEGSIDVEQFAWLRDELAANSATRLAADGTAEPAGGTDRLIVVLSHHPIASMTNPMLAPGETDRRVLGDEVRDELLRWPNVVLWVNGHTHRNGVQVHRRTDGRAGFWEVNTAAHVDWPCQARVLEIVDNRDGTLSVFATLVDPEGVLDGSPGAPLANLTALAYELAANDPQQRGNPADPNQGGRRGDEADRNVELLVPAPFALGGKREPVRATTRRSGPKGGTLAATGLPEPVVSTAAAVTAAAAGTAAVRRRVAPGGAAADGGHEAW